MKKSFIHAWAAAPFAPPTILRMNAVMLLMQQPYLFASVTMCALQAVLMSELAGALGAVATVAIAVKRDRTAEEANAAFAEAARRRFPEEGEGPGALPPAGEGP